MQGFLSFYPKQINHLKVAKEGNKRHQLKKENITFIFYLYHFILEVTIIDYWLKNIYVIL